MAGLSDADQGGLPVSRFDSGRAAGARPRALHGPGATQFRATRTWHPGVAKLLLQIADHAARTLSGARSVHPIDEAEEHAAPLERRRTNHPLGTGVLRLVATE